MSHSGTRSAPARMRLLAAAFTAVVAVVLGLSTSSAAVAIGSPLPATSREAASVGTDVVKTANLANFTPGNIVSDAVFFNSATMSADQVQSFLQTKVPSCQAGYTCLKDWYDTTRTTVADAMCGAYSGGVRERASTIIAKVAQACGINPQVILATLQKEQGLVLHTWPSDFRYKIAMGQGCPDTAACDTRYYGFFNQVFGAAWQFKRYANPPGTSKYFTWYAPGKTWNVQWNPNSGCGSSPVAIQNQATANLYYYTPYQPNAAAIRAGYGTGDGCSSYGNRNFYQYFTDWFGATQRNPAAEIEAEYQAQGGATGLGAPTSTLTTLTKNGGGFGTAFGGGSIYWTPSTGAKTVRVGAVRDYYFSRGGADGDLGWPAVNQSTVVGVASAGVAQVFTGGSLYAGVAGTFVVREPLRAGYFATGGAVGSLGWPVADQVCSDAGACRQDFEGGSVVSSASGAYPVVGAVRVAFDAAGGLAGEWGSPTMTGVSLPYAGGGYGQAFTQGSVYYRAGSAAYFVSGAVRDYYFSLGGAAGSLGYPVGAQQCSGTISCQQEFQFGWILWSSSGGSRLGAPAIDAAYAAAGGATGVLGARTGVFVYYPYNGGGLAEAYASGSIFYKTSVGAAFAVAGPVRNTYFGSGGAAGQYGWPTSALVCAGTVCRQDFEGGSIVSSQAGLFSLMDPVRAAYGSAGGIAGRWGVPASALVSISASGGGYGQVFTQGSVYYRAGGAAYFVSDAVRDYYFALGGAAGRLGFPVGAQQCSGTISCQQEFQFGWILWDSATGARVGAPAIDAVYAAAGGVTGVLGARMTSTLYYPYNGGGLAQGYENGAIYDKSSLGAHAVAGPMRDQYFATGGAAGPLGWPVSDQVCSDAGACRQVFEGATLTTTR